LFDDSVQCQLRGCADYHAVGFIPQNIRALDAGANEYLIKPVDDKSLIAVLIDISHLCRSGSRLTRW
jgi:FixJ family two-component response regulator